MAEETEGFVNTNGSFTEGWQGRLTDESLREDPSLASQKNINDLSKSFVATKKLVGRDPDTLVEIPTETSSDEVRAEFHRRRGVPEKPEDYKYERSKELSDNVDTSDEKVAAFSQIAKKYDLTPGQFNGIVNDYLALIDKDITAFDLIQKDKSDKEFANAETTLKKKWGNAYDEKSARANLLMKKYGGEEAVAKLGLQNSVEMVELFDAVAEDMSEDRIKGLTSVTTSTPSDIVKKINELKKNPAYLDANDPEHQDVVNQLTELYKKKNA